MTYKDTQKEAEATADMAAELEKINNEPSRRRSAWGRGVAAYAWELLENLEKRPKTIEELNAVLLNGASDWTDYSYGGCSLIYDCDIAERLCTPSELKKTRNGERRPNSREEWLGVQARALTQAAARVRRAWRQSGERYIPF